MFTAEFESEGAFRKLLSKAKLADEVDVLFSTILKSNGGGDNQAQLNQDIFALVVSGFKRNGFFVEFGATNGLESSNTFLLEKSFGWDGILAEPAAIWHDDLLRNRNCRIEFDCVWKATGETIDFDIVVAAGLSTISRFAQSDMHAEKRKNKTTCKLETISLRDLLGKHNAPSFIDYMSVDTEGSEFEILEAFDFDEYQFGLITIEHNYTESREKLEKLMGKAGYKRVFQFLSKWDDWYVPDK